MPDAFFASTSKKRKRSSQTGLISSQKFSQAKKILKGAAAKKPVQQRKAARRDEELDSDATHSDIDDIDLRVSDIEHVESDREEYAYETPAEKRLRLAKIYLDSVEEGLQQGEGEFDAAEIDRDIISARLKEDILEHAGKLHIFIADLIALDDPTPSRLRVKGHRLAVTSALLSHDATRIYMAGKEGGVSCCDVASGKRISYAPKLRPPKLASGSTSSNAKAKGKGKTPVGDLPGHSDEVLALALSGDGKYLASAGKDRIIGVWNVGDDGHTSDGAGGVEGLVWVKGFGGHKDVISALSFRKATNTLYSASADRTIKLFDLSPGVMGYVETLFGHQDSVTGLDSLKGDTAVSCGSRDRTCRFWKIADETQLVFRGGGAGKSKARDILEGTLEEDEDVEMEQNVKARKGKGKERWVEGSVDCVAMVDEHTFVSGGDSGSISLWSINKKKPIFTYTTAHGLEEVESSTEGRLRRPRWIMSLACLRYGDLFASGSWDGCIRLWKLDPSLRSFSMVGFLDAPGLINSLQLTTMPKGWSKDEGWSRVTKLAVNGSKPGNDMLVNGDHLIPPHKDDISKSATTVGTRSEDGVLLVAAVGQEPRLGRWIRLKGEGVVNSTLVFALRRRKVAE